MSNLMCCRKVFIILFPIAVFLAGSAISASAQGKISVAADSTIKIVNPIPLSNIGTATEETLNKLRDFRTSAKSTTSELALDSIIPKTLYELEGWKQRLTADEIADMRIRQTEVVKIEFLKFRLRLEDWRKTYSGRIEEFIQIQQELTVMQTQWQLTRDFERQEKLPEQVLIRINENLNEIALITTSIVERKNTLLTKQTELTGAKIYVDDILNAIAKVERSYKEKIFALDMPPIWQVFSEKEDSTATINQFVRVFKSHREDFGSFSINYRENIYWHGFFFAILVALLYLLRSEVRTWSSEKKDESVGHSLFIINRPFSSALLIALLSSGLFYPGVSPDILNYYYVLLIIPMLRVIPWLIPSIEKKYFYYVAFVFLLSQAGDHYSEVIILERFNLLILDALSIYILMQLLFHREEIAQKTTTINWRFAFNIMRIAVVIFVASIIANIVGNTYFARVISRGTLIMIYGGTIIYAGTLVVRGIFSLLMQYKSIAGLNMIQNYSNEVRGHLNRTVNLLAVVYWLFLTLDGYLLYDSLSEWVVDVLTREWVVGSVSLSLGSILAFFITLWISLLLSRFIRFILQDEILTHFELPRGVPGAIAMIIRLAVILVGFILALGAAKIEMSNVAIVFGALGVGIGFGLQNIFNNLVSGLILAFERPVQIGDVVQISSINILGEVKDIGIRASTIRTFDGAEVIVPNGNLISNEMINWTLSDSRRRQEIIVGVAYGTDTKKVIKLLNKVVPDNENVLKDPPPVILFQGFGESSLDFRILFWTHFQMGIATKSEVGVAVDTAFKKAGIVIPFPQRDLYLKSVPEQKADDTDTN